MRHVRAFSRNLVKSFVSAPNPDDLNLDFSTIHHDRTGLSQKPINLDSICVAVNHGCMGLPQELVDHIMDMLYVDLQALKACSLTCKAMFSSTRHLIHQTLCLNVRNNNSILTREEKDKHRH